MAVYSVDTDPVVANVLAGHFIEEAGYGTLRTQGSRSWLLIVTASGAGRFRHRSGEVVCQAGDAALLRPMTMHEYGVASGVDRWDLLWAHFHPRPHWNGFLDWPPSGPGLAVARLGEGLEDVRDAMRRCLEAPDELLAMVALEEALIRCWRRTEANPETTRDPRVRRAIEWIARDLRRPVSIPELSDKVGLSASRLSHLFQAEVGIPPRAYAEHLRIARARQLLSHTSMTVREVAAEVGFESEFYFSNRFRHLNGQSPTAWRNEQWRKEPRREP